MGISLFKIRYWADDRYNPSVYPSADDNTNVNLGDNIIYNDILGGNRVEKITNERLEYRNNSYEKLKDIKNSADE